MRQPFLYVITGGPGTGKTTVLHELERRGYHCMPEGARALIREQVEANGCALPWADAPRYAGLLLQRSLQTYLSAAVHVAHATEPVFFDRGIGDAIAYAGMIGHALEPEVLRRTQGMRYADPVFLAPWWPEIYTTDTERRQSPQEAEHTEHAIAETYGALGYRVLRLPLLPAAQRAKFILQNLTPASPDPYGIPSTAG